MRCRNRVAKCVKENCNILVCRYEILYNELIILNETYSKILVHLKTSAMNVQHVIWPELLKINGNNRKRHQKQFSHNGSRTCD